jgi:hypothetical protein
VRAFAAFLIVASATAAALAFVATTGDPPGAAAPPRPAAAPGDRVSPGTVLARRPFLGVSCREPNSIRCDRVGLAVWLRRPADSVRAAIAGRRFRLDDPDASVAPLMFAGFLRPAGLADGALRVPFTARGKWFGEGRPAARVRIWIDARGRTMTTALSVPLHAGWG